jgi:hypothetical protein
MQKQEQGFAITGGKGFAITFENGTTISVQFGRGNYCANKNLGTFIPNTLGGNHESPNAEVAMWNAVDQLITRKFTHDSQGEIGWVSPEYVAKAIAWTARYDLRYGKKMYDSTLEITK